jgi:hypothetical protein
MEQSQINLFEDLNNEELISIEGGNVIKGILKIIEYIGIADFLNELKTGIVEGYKDGRKDFK